MKNRRKQTKIFWLSILLFVFGAFSFFVFGQEIERERPKLKDFGSSLKRKKEENAKTKQINQSDDDAITIKTNLIVNDVLVLDEKGYVVENLTAEDFIITENGEKQNIEIFALGGDAKIPRSIVLLIDYSISQVPYIVNSIMSAQILVDSLNPQDRMAIVTDSVELLCNFTNDKKLLKKKLESLKSAMILRNFGQSRQYSALTATLKELFHSEDIRRIVIFQTDGDQINLSNKPFDVNALNDATEKTRATIYSIFPGMRYNNLSEKEKYMQSERELKSFQERFNRSRTEPDLKQKPLPPPRKMIVKHYTDTSAQQTFLINVSKSTGGWTSFLETPMQADETYKKILESINKRYVVGYYPSNEKADGKRRTVKIEVKNHPEYQIEGRKTYILDDTEN